MSPADVSSRTDMAAMVSKCQVREEVRSRIAECEEAPARQSAWSSDFEDIGSLRH